MQALFGATYREGYPCQDLITLITDPRRSGEAPRLWHCALQVAERQKFPHEVEPSPPVDSGAPNFQKTPKATMLKFGDVSFDLGFERGRMSATGYVAKISMLRLNIGSGKLSSCMLSIGLGPKCEQGKGGRPPHCLERLWVLGQCRALS